VFQKHTKLHIVAGLGMCNYNEMRTYHQIGFYPCKGSVRTVPKSSFLQVCGSLWAWHSLRVPVRRFFRAWDCLQQPVT